MCLYFKKNIWKSLRAYFFSLRFVLPPCRRKRRKKRNETKRKANDSTKLHFYTDFGVLRTDLLSLRRFLHGHMKKWSYIKCGIHTAIRKVWLNQISSLQPTKQPPVDYYIHCFVFLLSPYGGHFPAQIHGQSYNYQLACGINYGDILPNEINFKYKQQPQQH